MVILQKIGKAVPSIAETLIERLPDENDPQRPMDEKVAQNVSALAYIGLWSCRILDDPLTILCLFHQPALRQ